MTAFMHRPLLSKKKLWKNSQLNRCDLRLAGEKIQSILTHAPGNGASIGGLKSKARNGWFAARPSGTEDIYKIYAESFREEDHLSSILEEAQEIVNDALAAAPVTRAKVQEPLKEKLIRKANICTGKPIYSLLPMDVEGFDSLAELALDLRWSWNHATDEVWRQLDPALWELTQNPMGSLTDCLEGQTSARVS